MDLNVVATIKIMPEGPDVDLKAIEASVREIVDGYGKVNRIDIKPVAFGLKSVEVIALLSDSEGGIDEIESQISMLDGVSSVETIGVDRL